MQNPDSPQLVVLEQQFDILIKRIQQLKKENALLRQQVTKSIYERQVLTDKNQKAQQRLNTLITQLKTENLV